jgi:aldose 1-epimerase
MQTSSAPFPSGSQHEIRNGDHAAVITEIGATLRALALGGSTVLDGFDAGEASTAGRGQVLAPWPNRLEDGSYAFLGREGKAELNEPERGNAIHGLVRWQPWTLDLKTGDSVVLRHEVSEQPAYPWDLDLRVTYALANRGLRVTTEATNRSREPAPFGIGFHPYFTAGTETVDDALLTIPAGERLLTDERALPSGRAPVSDTAFDFRRPRTVGTTRLDTAFTSLERDGAGRAMVRLERSNGSGVSIWMDERFGYVQVYTGDTLEPANRRRRGIAIEPMTCPPNALRSGTDLIRLEPGASWRADWGVNA